MQKSLFTFLLFFFFIQSGFSQTLSPNAKISLLICAPGDEIYSYFGHAAIRVNDPDLNRDIVFNYGVFSFETPNFIWRFAKGETDYQLAVQRMSSFMREYTEDKRSVTEYILLLTSEERNKLFDALIENYKPENRIYRYNHFIDNCSTRLRDQIENAVNKAVVYDTSEDKILTFRNLIDQYIVNNSWSGLGIKLALGIPTDRQTTYSEKMFIPDYLGADMSKAFVKRGDQVTPLTSKPLIILDEPSIVRSFQLTSPSVVIGFVFLLVSFLTIFEFKNKRRFIALDIIVFFSFGIAGAILFFTTFISVMPSASSNLNLIWAWPTHILIGILWFFKSMRYRLIWYMKLSTVVVILFLTIQFFLPQTFHILVIPLCLIFLMRSSTLSFPRF